MSIFLLQLLLSLVLWTQHLTDGVAPGDEEPLCDELRALGSIPTPDYDPTMRVLMDTWNYNNLLPVRTGSVWEQVDNDNNNHAAVTSNWIQNSNNPCRQTVQVCGFSAGAQDNWLITQLINRTENRTRLSQVSVIIELEQRDCDVTLNCQRSFNTHVYERSSENTAASRTISNYRQVQRVSPDDTSGNRVNETISIDFASTSHETSFYFAVQDETTCIVIDRIIMFYQVCPRQTSDLIHYPETIAPNSGTISVSASCVVNAVTESGGNPLVVCSAGGLWSTPSGKGCQCSPGYFSQFGTCLPCPRGTYLSPSNGSCSACPANSVSEREGLSQCTCVDGYYRALQGEEDIPCYLPPSPPRNIRLITKTENLISITWDSPARPGSHDLTYGVYVSRNSQNRRKIQQVNETIVTISELLPGETYTVYISSENTITDQVPEEQFSMISTSLIVSTKAGSADNFTSSVAVAAVIPSLLSLALLVSLIVVTVWLCRNNKDLKRQLQNGRQTGEVYYSTVKDAVSTGNPKMEKNIAYEDIAKI